ncbi:hypothetical protein [Nostoc sp.]
MLWTDIDTIIAAPVAPISTSVLFVIVLFFFPEVSTAAVSVLTNLSVPLR